MFEDDSHTKYMGYEKSMLNNTGEYDDGWSRQRTEMPANTNAAISYYSEGNILAAAPASPVAAAELADSDGKDPEAPASSLPTRRVAPRGSNSGGGGFGLAGFENERSNAARAAFPPNAGRADESIWSGYGRFVESGQGVVTRGADARGVRVGGGRSGGRGEGGDPSVPANGSRTFFHKQTQFRNR